MLKEITVHTRKKNDIVDINDQVLEIARESKIKDGICNVFTAHATAAIIINENADPNVSIDFLDALNELVKEGRWRHDRIDNNGAAHIKAAIVGPSETIPIKDSRLMLGRWQSIMLADFDGPRERKVIVSIIGNK